MNTPDTLQPTETPQAFSDLLPADALYEHPDWEIWEVVVTPEIAQHWLENSSFRNRAVNDAHVNRLVEQMRSNKFKASPQVISLTHTGDILDGQHRLHAIVKSGRPEILCIAYGVDPGTFNVFDSTARARTISDWVGIHELTDKNKRECGAALRACHSWEKSGTIDGSASAKLNPDDLPELWSKYPLEQDLPRAREVRATTGMALSVSLTAVHLTRANNPNLDQTPWFEGLIGGIGLRNGDPALALRNFSMWQQAAPGRRGLDRTGWMRAYVMAWNAWAQGRSLKQVRVSAKSPRIAKVTPPQERLL